MIGLLNAYHFDTTPGNYQEKYEPIMLNYLQAIMPQQTIRTYQVAQGKFPKDIHECEGYIITGSPASVYDDEAWINDLMEFIHKLHQAKKKLVGICFGHQIIAHALGGEADRCDKGWGIGKRKFPIFKEKPWMTPKLTEDCSLLFSHQDQVYDLPKGAEKLGGDDFCEFQLYSLEDHIFCMQGHPEFTVDYAKERYQARVEFIGEDVVANALTTMEDTSHEVIVGKWIKNFFE